MMMMKMVKIMNDDGIDRSNDYDDDDDDDDDGTSGSQTPGGGGWRREPRKVTSVSI